MSYSPSEDDYYRMIEVNLTEVDHELAAAYDHVASQEEFTRFEKAMLRWIADKRASWEQQAIDTEHGNE